MFGILLWWFASPLYENTYWHESSTQTQFWILWVPCCALKPNFECYEFLVVECCYTLDICIFFKNSEIIIFIIKIQPYFLCIYLAKNAVFFPAYHINAIQDDIAEKPFQSDYITRFVIRPPWSTSLQNDETISKSSINIWIVIFCE